jgi:hypothetical protein
MAETEELRGWLSGRVPSGWFEGAPEVMVDREEILVLGTLPDVQVGKEGSADELAAARSGRIRQHREDTREERMRIAREAQRRFQRIVSWGARCGDVTELFTTMSVPVMTRLRMPERQLLDALVEAGVARSRSHALAWCVRLVGRHQGEWVKELREAVTQLGRVRSANPLN